VGSRSGPYSYHELGSDTALLILRVGMKSLTPLFSDGPCNKGIQVNLFFVKGYPALILKKKVNSLTLKNRAILAKPKCDICNLKYTKIDLPSTMSVFLAPLSLIGLTFERHLTTRSGCHFSRLGLLLKSFASSALDIIVSPAKH